MVEAPMTRPAGSLIGETVRETSINVPSLASRTVSTWSIDSPRLRRSMMERTSPGRSGGINTEMGRPMTSSGW